MLELTTANSPARIALSEKHARIVINRADYLLVLCLKCGGAKSITLHVLPGQCNVPTLFECQCDKPIVLTIQEDAYAATSP